MLNLAVDITYFVTAFVFIYGLKQMSSPVTARGGIVIAGIAMVAATLITFADPQIHLVLDINMILMLSAIAAGSAVAYISAKRVASWLNYPEVVTVMAWWSRFWLCLVPSSARFLFQAPELHSQNCRV